MTDGAASVRNYFVDEAGDSVLFNRRGRVIIGTEGCSRFFILGLLDVADPLALSDDLDELRANLLADPYFKDVSSMQPSAGKTAHAFHAKDDLPEVRREVFALLKRHELKFFAVVRDKQSVLADVRERNERDPAYRYHPNGLYDQLVKRLFRDRLHKDDAYHICFAKRGFSDRTEALSRALSVARERFRQKWGIISAAPIQVKPSIPKREAGLQAADYFLWSLQRLYERREDRFCELLWPAFSLVHDVDDTRQAPYGVYYTQRTPLTLGKMKKKPEI